MLVTVTSTRLILSGAGFNLVFNGQDIIRATPTAPRVPDLNTAPNQGVVTLDLTGPAREALGATYIINVSYVSNQPTWTNDLAGATVASQDISVMIRSASGGGGGGQVDTIVPGDAIDVDATDPVNPIVSVKYDGATIGLNGSNELESLVDVTGFVEGPSPAASTNNNIPLWDGVSGRLLKDGLAYSAGGNYAADSGKALVFGAEGQIQGRGVNADAVTGISTNGSGVRAESSSSIAPALEAVGVGGYDIAHFHDITASGMNVLTDGGLEWTSGTGAQTTADNLPVFGAAAQGVVPAAGAVPAATNFLDETGNWDAVDAGDLSGLGTGVATALGQNADSATGFVTQTGGDARYLLASNELITVLGSTQTTTSTSLVDCTGLSVAVDAGSTYQIEGFILFQSTATTNGISISLNGPSSPTEFAAQVFTSRLAISNSVNNMNAYNQSQNSLDVIAANTSQHANIHGTLVNGATAGDLIVRFASESGAQTVRIMAGSSLRLRKVA